MDINKNQLKRVADFYQLPTKQKWEYLKAFWKLGTEFYGYKRDIIPEEKIINSVKSFKEKPSPKIRKVLDLDKWRYKLDPNSSGKSKDYLSKDYDDSQWKQVTLPHVVDYVLPNPEKWGRISYRAYNPGPNTYTDVWVGEYSVWYRTKVTTQELQDKRAFLRFESTNLEASVWVNEAPVMLNHLGLFPFQMGVNEELVLSKGEESQITLEIKNRATNVPTLFYNGFQCAYSEKPFTKGRQDMDWPPLTWGGISGPAKLSIVHPVFLKDVFLHTTKLSENSALIAVEIEVENTQYGKFQGKVIVELSKWFPKESSVVKKVAIPIELRPLSTVTQKQEVIINQPDLWTPDSPNLYLTHVILTDQNGTSLDDLYETFGVRTFEMRGSRFFLNNRAFVPMGTHNIGNYPDSPVVCPRDYWIVQDILLHKNVGFNGARWPSDNKVHYERIAEYADQMGFLLIWGGFFNMWLVPPELEMLAQRDVPAMIRALRNHPSIVMWEMGDEAMMRKYPNRRQAWLQLVYDLVVENDPTRPISPNGMWSNELVDIIENYTKQGKNIEQARNEALQNFPVYDKPNVYWDIHWCTPSLPPRPIYPTMERFSRFLGQHRPILFTEFGMDGMPNWEWIKEDYGHPRWMANPLWMLDRAESDRAFLGKELSSKDWQESQAFQAVTLKNQIGYLIERPHEYASFHMIYMRDVWTWFWGLTDRRGQGKLSYFGVKNLLKPVFISGMHGNYVFDSDSKLKIRVKNAGEDISSASLTITVKDKEGDMVREDTMENLFVPAGKVSDIVEYPLQSLKAGLYALEYKLIDAEKKMKGNSLDLIYVT